MTTHNISNASGSRWFAHPATLWVAFAAVNVWTAWLNFSAANQPLGDVNGIYWRWVSQILSGQDIPGITAPWVYPVAALAPLLLAALPGMATYPQNWLVMIALLNALAFFFLVGGWRRPVRRLWAAWWWIAFIVCLGPITLGRLDSVTAPLAVLGLMFLLTRPRLAAVVLALATWIKVWPAALLLAAVALMRRRWTIVISAALASAATLVGWALVRSAAVWSPVVPTTLPGWVDRLGTVVVLGAAAGVAYVLVRHPLGPDARPSAGGAEDDGLPGSSAPEPA